MHATSAIGVPVAALFGLTDYRIWKPPGEKNVVLHKDIDCWPWRKQRHWRGIVPLQYWLSHIHKNCVYAGDDRYDHSATLKPMATGVSVSHT